MSTTTPLAEVKGAGFLSRRRGLSAHALTQRLSEDGHHVVMDGPLLKDEVLWLYRHLLGGSYLTIR